VIYRGSNIFVDRNESHKVTDAAFHLEFTLFTGNGLEPNDIEPLGRVPLARGGQKGGEGRKACTMPFQAVFVRSSCQPNSFAPRTDPLSRLKVNHEGETKNGRDDHDAKPAAQAAELFGAGSTLDGHLCLRRTRNIHITRLEVPHTTRDPAALT